MPFITPVRATKLLLQSKPSQSLPPTQWRDRVAGDKLGICGAKKEGNFWRVKLAGELTIGGTKTDVVYLWPPDWEGVGEVFQATMQAMQAKAIQSFSAPPQNTFKRFNRAADGSVVEVLLNAGYKSQTDNRHNPGGSCNVTSIAMGLVYFGLTGKREGYQLEDELYEEMEARNWSRHSPEHLARIAEVYGMIDRFTSFAKLADIKASLAAGRPCIFHGWFTGFGHIIVAVGYDEQGFWIHDPYGEWTAGGYLKNDAANPERGKFIHYSYGLIDAKCRESDGSFWCHFLDRSGLKKSSTPPPMLKEENPPQSTAARLLKPQEFHITESARELINSWEGWRPNQYICLAGKSTIGWGSTRWFDGGEIPSGATVNESQARQLQDRDLEEFVADIRQAIDVPLTENQLSALISWQYNTGAVGAKHCGLRDAINRSAGDAAIVAEFRRWNKAGGRVSEGLINRRESEVALWEGRDWRQYRG